MAKTKAQIKAQAIKSRKQKYTELKDVVDVRTGQYHSVAVVKNEKYFVPVEEYSE